MQCGSKIAALATETADSRMDKKFVSGISPKSQWASENAPICSCWAIPRLKPSTLGTATTGVQTMLTKAQKRKKGVKLRLLKGRLVRQLALSRWRCQEGRAKVRSLALYHTGHAAHSTVFYSSAGRRGPFPRGPQRASGKAAKSSPGTAYASPTKSARAMSAFTHLPRRWLSSAIGLRRHDRFWHPNVQHKRVFSETLGKMVPFQMTTSALRSAPRPACISCTTPVLLTDPRIAG